MTQTTADDTANNNLESSFEPVNLTIKTITLEEPWKWLRAGWNDMLQAKKFSLTYGLIFVVGSFFITFALINGEAFFLLPAVAAGFFLLAPFLGVGLYGMSRAIENGEKVEFCQAKKAWQSNPAHLSAMGLILMMILLVWMLAAILIFAIFFTQPVPTWENFIPVLFLSGDSPLFLFIGILTGGIIALFTFSISVITVPLLMDQQIDFMRAINASVSAVKKNWKPMMLWAYLIALLVGIGILTWFIGLIVAMPVVGHATWHAYRDLVEIK